jgi:formylmethanofuran dehydrogenase subunit B
VAGNPATLEAAVSTAADILRASAAPLLYGLDADLHAIRALLALAERVGGVVDHRFSAPLLANAAVARASGWVTATFAEIANRADFILLVGGDPERNFPRFQERLIRNSTPLYREGAPTLAYMGPQSTVPPSAALGLSAAMGQHELLHGIAALNLLLRDRPLGAPHADLPVDALTEIARRLWNARYGVIAWDVSGYDPTAAELIVEYICAALRHLNGRTRSVGSPLGGSGNGLGAMQVALWQLGWPLRLGFGSGAPEHDPWRHHGERILDAEEADAVVWLSTLVADRPPRIAAPLIAIVADDVQLAEPPAVEFRVGIPGIDHPGEIVRADAVIAVPLQAIRPTDRPTAADVARAILAKLDASA